MISHISADAIIKNEDLFQEKMSRFIQASRLPFFEDIKKMIFCFLHIVYYSFLEFSHD